MASSVQLFGRHFVYHPAVLAEAWLRVRRNRGARSVGVDGQSAAASDAPLVRTCRLVLADQLDDWREGERALPALLVTDAAIHRAAACQGRLEKLLLAAGGVGGTR